MAAGLLNSLDEPRKPSALEPHANTPVAEYDLHFRYPVFEELRASGVVLRPYIPSIHARLDYDLFSQPEAQEVWSYLPYGPFESYHDYLVLVEALRTDPGTLICAVYNTADDPEGDFVGVFGYLNSDRNNLTTELGHARIHPKAQRTHVTSQTIALLLEHAFETWGVRRVQWYANALNIPSANTAKRIGFLYEGLQEWHRVLPWAKKQWASELSVPEDSKLGTPSAGYGRHSVVFGMSWKMWRDGKKDEVKRMKDREPVKRKA